MTYTILTANTSYCTDEQGVFVSERTMPFLEEWLRENGYELASDHQPTLADWREIDALPAGTIVLSRDGVRYVHMPAHAGAKRMLWFPVGPYDHFHTSGEIMPVTVLLGPIEGRDV